MLGLRVAYAAMALEQCYSRMRPLPAAEMVRILRLVRMDSELYERRNVAANISVC